MSKFKSEAKKPKTFMKHPENFPKLSRKYPENFLKIPEIYMSTLVFISRKFPCLIGCGLVIALQVTEIC